MQNQLRTRYRTPRLELLDEQQKGGSPSFFEWREQTVRTQAYKPEPKSVAKANSLIRLFRRFG